MKLGGTLDGTVYCTRGLEVGHWTPAGGFAPVGRLPTPESGVGRVRFSLLNGRRGKRLLRPVVGSYTTANVWPLTGGNVLATVGRWLFASTDGGRTWDVVHELPASSGPMGVLPTSVCEHDGRVYLAEYPLDEPVARILVSDDYGQSWSTYVSSTDVRHFHGVFVDPYTDTLWATTGDADEESSIGRLIDGEYHPVGRGSQQWRCVGLAFTRDAILWGMDCSFADEISILKLPRSELTADTPTPQVVGSTDSTVFYAETLDVGDETWVFLSTSSSTGIDSYAPPEKRRNVSGSSARVVASTGDFETWHELYSFPRRRVLGDVVQQFPTSNAYVFMATDPERGLLLNPYNTETHDGSIHAISPSTFDRLGRSASPTSSVVGGV